MVEVNETGENPSVKRRDERRMQAEATFIIATMKEGWIDLKKRRLFVVFCYFLLILERRKRGVK